VRLPSLAAAGAAVLLLAAVVGGAWAWANFQLSRDLDQVAAGNFKKCRLGLAIDEHVLQRPDYLPVYGSCELSFKGDANRIDLFFASAPTGFRIAPNGGIGNTSLLMAERFAALGRQLRGKKIVLILTPEWFFHDSVPTDQYAGNFSLEHAIGALRSPDIDAATKRRLAARMADYPGTLAKNAFFSQLVGAWNLDTPAARAIRPLTTTLADGFFAVQHTLDPIFMWRSFLGSSRRHPPHQSQAQSGQIDWDAALAESESQYEELCGGNPYGFRRDKWQRMEKKRGHFFYKMDDQQLLATLHASKEWEDFDILLSVLQQNGAQALVMSMPVNGTYYRALGTSPVAWRAYYNQARRVTRAHGFPLVDFERHEDDPQFRGYGDPNPKGWVYMDRAADAFFHNSLNRLKRTL
jgi:D-alanine transfer protein